MTRGIRDFMARDWAAVRRSKNDYWADQFARRGGGPARLASTALLLHARAVQPDFPSDTDRADDLAHHMQVRDRLDRAARALADR